MQSVCMIYSCPIQIGSPGRRKLRRSISGTIRIATIRVASFAGVRDCDYWITTAADANALSCRLPGRRAFPTVLRPGEPYGGPHRYAGRRRSFAVGAGSIVLGDRQGSRLRTALRVRGEWTLARRARERSDLRAKSPSSKALGRGKPSCHRSNRYVATDRIESWPNYWILSIPVGSPRRCVPGLAMLTCFTAERPVRGIADMAEELDWAAPPPTATRRRW